MSLTNFWYNWPSWVTEILGGSVLSLALCFGWHFVLPPDTTILASVLVGLLVSVAYEFLFDANRTAAHRPFSDIGQRACGQALGLLIWSML